MNNYVYQGHRARHGFSQNFLHDRDIIEFIVSAINPLPKQFMVEIGPGLGALTQLVAERSDFLTVIEIDRDLIAQFNKHPFFMQKNRLKIIQKDVLTVDFSTLSNQIGQRIRVFGNVPYHISTPLIFHLFKHINTIFDIHLMLQKELVNRLLARPNSKAYGRLSIIAQYYCEMIPILEVQSDAFRPKPKVESTVIRMIPYAIPPYPLHDLRKLVSLTRLAFNQRRKAIRNSLAHLFTAKQLQEQGISTTSRAENLSIEQYCNLANTLTDLD